MDKRKELILRNVIASHAIEGMEMDERDIQDCKDILEGKITADESIKKVLKEEGFDSEK